MALQQGVLIRDRYEIRRIIKSGGMGSVYEALDRNLSNPCAVKEMLEVVAQNDGAELIRRKFRQEAEILIQLQHPGVPRVRDFFTEGDVCYIVMDLVHGANLEQELADCQALTGRPFLPDVLVQDILQILDILVYMHSLSPPVIHRDIKPANLIREYKTGRIKLVDFGLARMAEAGRSQTMIGTLGYCPLEQMQGHAEPRSDIYALGVTMHQLVTGLVPAVLALEPLEQAAPGLDRRLAAVIEKATAHSPADRFASAAEMQRALRNWATAPEPPAPQREALARAWRETAGNIPMPPPPPILEDEPARANVSPFIMSPRDMPLRPRDSRGLRTPAPPPPRPAADRPVPAAPAAGEQVVPLAVPAGVLPEFEEVPEKAGWRPPQSALIALACGAFLVLGFWLGHPSHTAQASPSPRPPAEGASWPDYGLQVKTPPGWEEFYTAHSASTPTLSLTNRQGLSAIIQASHWGATAPERIRETMGDHMKRKSWTEVVPGEADMQKAWWTYRLSNQTSEGVRLVFHDSANTYSWLVYYPPGTAPAQIKPGILSLLEASHTADPIPTELVDWVERSF